ncbi:hypothetical protein M5K25_021498 [Dendrobium thyrsiflorum]|uniref:Uncharacterized protein n=1 Tax=Dendrobium thyrsiflorum TaxID=117978 RepID=A0ABD0UCS3_DENTH
MDEDCKLIEELKARIEYQRAQILQLENALLLDRTKCEELKKLKSDELHQSNEIIKELKQKIANFISIIDAKNVELQNLQTALGQYYAESEAKERFGRELAAAREESAKYSELLNLRLSYWKHVLGKPIVAYDYLMESKMKIKVSVYDLPTNNIRPKLTLKVSFEIAAISKFLKRKPSRLAASQSLETSKRENEEINVRLSQTERMLSESKGSLHKLEEDNSKLRHALERSMTTLNRMSLDSDNFVDRTGILRSPFFDVQFSEDDVTVDEYVDRILYQLARRIVIKLLVTYFQRNHSKEVLDLMVRMLGFSDEDKQRIGFAQHSSGKGVVRGVLGLPGRLVGGILGGSTAQASPSSSENQSFADLWVDFLLKETEERERRESSEDAQMYSVGQSDSARTSRAQVPSSASVKQYKPSEHLDAEFSTVPLTTATSLLPSHKNSQPIRSQRY